MVGYLSGLRDILVERDIQAGDRETPQEDRPPATVDISVIGISWGVVGYPRAV